MEPSSESAVSAGAAAKLRLPLKISHISWGISSIRSAPILLASAAAILLALHFVRPLPPHTIIMSGGPKGSSFEKFAEQLPGDPRRRRHRLKIIPLAGSLQNLQRLSEAHCTFYDIALVQAGITETGTATRRQHRGPRLPWQHVLSAAHGLCRGRRPILRLSQLAGKRIAIGREGSGTRLLALALLKGNGIDRAGRPSCSTWRGTPPVRRWSRTGGGDFSLGRLRATSDDSRDAAHARRPDVHVSAGGRLREGFPYLRELNIPAGTFDLGANLPARPLICSPGWS